MINSQASGTIHYLDSQLGNDNNPGTQTQPWKTIPMAIASLSPGDTIIFNSGIYMLDSTQTYFFGPAGLDVNHRTVYEAASGARVIITGFDQKPVNIHLTSYMIVQGLWFGGSWDTVDGIDAFGHGEGVNPLFVLGGPLNDVINCTFFGYGQTGNGGDYLFFQGNRSVRTGAGDLSHGIYLTAHDGTTNQEDNHAIVDNNIFIGQEIPNPSYGSVSGAPATYFMGLGIQVWHQHNNDIITRNFVAHHIANTIGPNADSDTSVRSELVANNFWWKNGADNTYPHGFYSHIHTWYLNNLGGPQGGIASGDIQTTTVGNTFLTNAFTLGSSNHLLPNAPFVSVPGPLAMSEADVAAAVGTTPTTIDQAIAALQNSFSIGVNGLTIQNLYQDQTVESNFAKLKFATQASSTLYQTGTAWFNPANPLQVPVANSGTNIGPDAPVPSSPGYFWAAFRALGMQDYDDSAHRMTAPYPTYPYPPPTPVQDTIGVFSPSTGTFYLRNTNTSGSADTIITFNPAHKPYPVVGDWTGFGVDTVGVFDQNNGSFSLCKVNGTVSCTNSANITQLTLGDPNDQPIAGRWSQTMGHDGVGVFRPSNGLIYLKNVLNTGYGDYTMVLGIPGDVGLAGDWNGDGVDSPGVFRPSNATFYLTDQVINGSVYGSYTLALGITGDSPIASDWIAQGHAGIGVFRKGQVYLKDALTPGYADISFAYGSSTDIPVAGSWGTGGPVANPVTSIIVPGKTPSAPSQIITGAPVTNGLGD
ncbi:MAG: hypothetical protein ACYDBJ_02180 [Aggregatilineales bacterium]